MIIRVDRQFQHYSQLFKKKTLRNQASYTIVVIIVIIVILYNNIWEQLLMQKSWQMYYFIMLYEEGIQASKNSWSFSMFDFSFLTYVIDFIFNFSFTTF